MVETIDYEKVVADLEAKRAMFNAWVDATIQNMRQVLSAVGALPLSPAAHQTPGHIADADRQFTPDMFFGLNIAEAAMLVLQTTKRQHTTREITDILTASRYHHTSQNFINTVNTALYRRERDPGDVIKIGRSWALSEWYPGRRKKATTEVEHTDREGLCSWLLLRHTASKGGPTGRLSWR